MALPCHLANLELVKRIRSSAPTLKTSSVCLYPGAQHQLVAMVVHTQGPQSNKSSKSGIGKRASEVGGLRKAGKSSSSRARDGTSQAFWYLLLPLLVAAAAAIAGAIYLQPVRHPVTLRPNARSRSPHHDDKERAAAEQAAADLAAVKKAAANKAAKQAAAERAAVQKVAAEEAAADLAAAEKAAAAKVSAELAEAERAEAALAAAEHTKAAEEPTKAAAAAAGSARPAAHAPPPVSRPAARPPPRIIKTASENAAAERSAEAAAEWSANAAAAWSSKAAARAPSLVDDIGGATVRSVLAALLPTCDTSAKAGASAFLNAFLTGNDLKHARKYTDALSCYKLALSLQQDTEQQASVYNNLGAWAQWQLGRLYPLNGHS